MKKETLVIDLVSGSGAPCFGGILRFGGNMFRGPVFAGRTNHPRVEMKDWALGVQQVADEWGCELRLPSRLDISAHVAVDTEDSGFFARGVKLASEVLDGTASA